jgi:hypothetical protein
MIEYRADGGFGSEYGDYSDDEEAPVMEAAPRNRRGSNRDRTEYMDLDAQLEETAQLVIDTYNQNPAGNYETCLRSLTELRGNCSPKKRMLKVEEAEKLLSKHKATDKCMGSGHRGGKPVSHKPRTSPAPSSSTLVMTDGGKKGKGAVAAPTAITMAEPSCGTIAQRRIASQEYKSDLDDEEFKTDKEVEGVKVERLGLEGETPAGRASPSSGFAATFSTSRTGSGKLRKTGEAGIGFSGPPSKRPHSPVGTLSERERARESERERMTAWESKVEMPDM